MDKADIARHESKIDRSGGPDACHPWTGSTNEKGYGTMWLSRTCVRAARVAWMRKHGPIPAGAVVRHVECGNPPCCNVRHLTLGTHAENMRDRDGQRRAARGELSGRARYSDADIAAVRAAVAAGEPQKAVAARTGMSRSHVSAVVRGVWRAAT